MCLSISMADIAIPPSEPPIAPSVTEISVSDPNANPNNKKRVLHEKERALLCQVEGAKQQLVPQELLAPC